MSTEVEKRQESQVPALVATPALEIDGGDISLPKLYIGQQMSQAVQDELVKSGQIYLAAGEDDPDPQVIFDPDSKAKSNDGVLIHVLGMRKTKSLSENGELTTFSFHDPDAPPEAWVVYNYVVALPEIEEDVPVKMAWSRTKTPAAKVINTQLAKRSDEGPPWSLAFRVTTVKKKNNKGTYFVPRVVPVDSTEENVALAERLAVLISGTQVDRESTGDEPAI